MLKINELEKYLNFEFSTGWNTGEDYRKFENEYIKCIKLICKKYDWKVIKINKNHYQFSMFIRNNNNKIIYLAINDVRYYKNEWYNKILVRIANSENDYVGEKNNYCSLDSLHIYLNRLFEI